MLVKNRIAYSVITALILCVNISGIYAEKAAPVYGVIAFVSGDATITKNNKKIPAKLSMRVDESDTVITKNGLIRIQIADAYICHIEKNTTITFKKILDRSDIKSYNIYLHKGQIFSRLIPNKSKPGELSVSSPSVTAGVRGTDFMVSETGEEDASKKSMLESLDSEKIIPSGVYVSSGSVDVETAGANKGKKINVKSGEQVTVAPGEMIKAILDDYVATKMKILEELKIMKEFNCKLIEEQKEVNRKLLEELK